MNIRLNLHCFLIIASLLFIFSCDSGGGSISTPPPDDPVDLEAPTLTDSSISPTSVTSASLTLNWTEASDDLSDSADLRYIVYYSTNPDIDTIENAEANGTPLTGYTVGITSLDVADLIADTTYYFFVIVLDETDKKTGYTMLECETDAGLPEVTDSTVTPSAITSKTLTLSWNAATDDITSQEDLEYIVYSSISANIDTVANAEANGTPLNSYTANITTLDLSSLDPKTTYYFNVVVKDEMGVKTAYTMCSAYTPWLPRTGQTTSYTTGDDGDLEAGSVWPDPRFTDNGNTITDNMTGLMWVKNGNVMLEYHPESPFDTDNVEDDGKVTWQHALDYVAWLNSEAYLGYSDWRLPNINEIQSLMNYGVSNAGTWLQQYFTNVSVYDLFWTSTTCYDSNLTAFDYKIRGFITYLYKTEPSPLAFPVRTATTGLIDLPKTGQTTSYTTGDDGDLETGSAWPDPRFTDNGDTITDNTTGLMWQKAPSTTTCTWADAFTYIESLNTAELGGYSDWRFPNINEISSLIHYGQEPYSWLNSNGFIGIQGSWYWSSTTYPVATTCAYRIYLENGHTYFNNKTTGTFYVIGVRGGI